MIAIVAATLVAFAAACLWLAAAWRRGIGPTLWRATAVVGGTVLLYAAAAALLVRSLPVGDCTGPAEACGANVMALVAVFALPAPVLGATFAGLGYGLAAVAVPLLLRRRPA